MRPLTRKEFLQGAAAMALAVSGDEAFASPEKTKRGDFVFFSNRVFAPGSSRTAELETIRRFRVCLTNGYQNFDGKERDTLRAAGCDLFIYIWFNGFYQKEAGAISGVKAASQPFPEMTEAFQTVQSHPEWLLNPGQPLQGSGAVYPAFFFDYGSVEFRAFFAGFIRKHLRNAGYNGVFFDYIGGWALPEAAKTLWNKRHPGLSYDSAGVTFLRELRQAVPGVRIFGNQAYRLTPDYYDCIDYDISESHGTSFVWGKEASLFVKGKGMQSVRETFYRLWDGPAGYKAISQPRREMAVKKPRVEVFDLNYLQPRYVPTGEQATVEGRQVPIFAERTDRPAIFYGYALAKLTGITDYASDWYAPGFGGDDLYFLDLGTPVSSTFREENEVVTRAYQNGFIAVTRRGGPVAFTQEFGPLSAKVTGLWDVYEKRRIPESARSEITIRPAAYPVTRSHYPSGRVYLYCYD